MATKKKKPATKKNLTDYYPYRVLYLVVAIAVLSTVMLLYVALTS